MIINKNLILLFLAVLLFVNVGKQLYLQPMPNLLERSIAQQYQSHAPIIIHRDYEISSAATSGTGSINDPYIISNWNITGSSSHGIHIYGTTKHIRVENCWIDGAIRCGIILDQVAPGTITIANNICRNNGMIGIHLYFSDSSTVVNNTCSHNWIGIESQYSRYSTIVNNTCNRNDGLWGGWNNRWLGRVGIYLDNSSFETLINNTCNENECDGIRIKVSRSLTLINNTCNNNDINGLSISYSDSLLVANTTCINNNNNGIYFEYSGGSTVINNTCNSNDHYGIYFWDSTELNLTNNICVDNGVGSIYPFDINSNSTTTTTISSTSGLDIDPILIRMALLALIIGVFVLLKRSK